MNALLFLILAAFWSGSFLFIKITVLNLAPLLSALIRLMIAQLAFTLYFSLMRAPLKAKFSSIWRAWVVGIFLQGIPFAFLFLGECHVTPALASIINGTVAVWVMVFSVVIFRDFSQVTIPKTIGLILGISGIVVIFAPMLGYDDHSSLFAVLGIVIMAMSYALGALLNQRFNKSRYAINLEANLWHQHWSSTAFLLALVLIFEPHINLHPFFALPSVWLSLLYLGICSTAVAFFIYCHLIHTWGAIRASSVMYVVPILTMIWDMLFLHLWPTLNELGGITIILLGVYLIQFSKNRPT